MNGIIYEILMKKLLKSVQDEISCMLFFLVEIRSNLRFPKLS